MVLGQLLASVWVCLPTRSAAATNYVGPLLVCPEPVFQFGIVSNQSQVIHTFSLYNAGAATAHISRVVSSCGCVVPELDQKELTPGQQTSLRATFSLAGRTGHQRRVIRVMGTDPVTPYVELWLEGDVVRCDFEPETINFGTILPADASTRLVRLAGGAVAGRITHVESDSALFLASVAEGGHGVEVRARPPLPDGVSQATVLVWLTNAPAAVAKLPVTAMVVPAVRVTPATIELPRDAPYATRTVWIRPGRAGAFTIRDVQSPVASVTPLLTDIGGGIYRLDLKNIPVTAELQGTSLTLLTSLTNMPAIAIPFRFENQP
jgi:hypothetical protein